MILGIVERARKGALKDSAYGLIEAGNIFYTQKLTQGSNIDELKFTMTNGKFILNGTEEELKFKGEKPTSGNLTITPTKASIRITDGTYCAYKSMENLEVSVTKGNCSNVDEEGVTQEEQKLSNVYPVGSIYMNIDNVNPSELFGGEWVKIEDTFLLGSGSSYALGSTGGEATHTLTVDEMPSHNHDGLYYRNISSAFAITLNHANIGYGLSWGASGGYGNAEIITGITGGSQPHNNMPPYISVNIWKRTA
jgi:hypothetical protein